MKIIKGEHFISTQLIDIVMNEIEEVEDDFVLYFTSGFRGANDQLRIIVEKARIHKIVYPELDPTNVNKKITIPEFSYDVYTWYRTWGKLLNIGEIVNPPFDAICPYDYINSSGVNKKGQLILQTPHARGRAFDVAARPDMATVEAKIKMLMERKVGIKNYKVEPVNGAVHCDCG